MADYTYENTFEGGTDGVAISTTNSGGSSGQAFNNVTATSGSLMEFDTAQPRRQTVTALHNTTSGSTAYYRWDLPVNSILYGRCYYRFANSPNQRIIQITSDAGGTGSSVGWGILSNKFVLRDSAGAVAATSVMTVPLNQWIRLEWLFNSTGATELRIYTSPNSDVPAETLTVASMPTLAQFGSVRNGALVTATTMHTDDFGATNLGWLGPKGITSQQSLISSLSALATLARTFIPVPGGAGSRTPRVRAIRSTAIATNLGQLAAYGTATATPTTTTVGAFAIGTTSIRYRNAASSVAAAPPTSGTAPVGEGWRDSATEHTTESVRYSAGTWTARTKVRKTGQILAADVTIRVTWIMYRVSSAGAFIAEVGRGISADTLVSTADLNISSSFTTTGELVLNPGDLLQIEVYVQNIAAGLPAAATAAYNIILLQDQTLATTGSAISAQPNYRILYTRVLSAVQAGAASLVRRLVIKRSLTRIATGTPTIRRLVRKRVTAIGTGVATFRRKTSKRITAIGTGVATFRRKTTKTLTVPAVAKIASLGRRLSLRRTLTATGVGTATLSRAIRYKRVLTAIGSGVATLARRFIFSRVLAVTAIGTASIRRKTNKRLVVPPVAKIATIARRLSLKRRFTLASTGVASLARRVSTRRAFSVIATGIAVITKRPVVSRRLTATGAGIASMRRKTNKILTRTAVGTATLTRRFTLRRSLSVVSTGVVSIRRFIRKRITVSSAGLSSIRRRTSKRITVTALGTASLVRKLVQKRTFAAVGTGIATIRRKTAKRITRTAVGTATLARRASLRRSLSAAATGLTSIGRRLVLRRALTAVGIGVGTVRRKTTKRITVSAVGVPGFVRKLVQRRFLSAASTGVAFFNRRIISARLLHAVAVGRAKALIKIPFEKLPVGEGGTVITVVKKIFAISDD